MKNTYIPSPARIKKIFIETEDKQLKSFWVQFLYPADSTLFKYTPGQFAELSISGYGEIPIGIASSPTEGNLLLFTVNKVGIVTSKLHEMNIGDIIGIRGPLGNNYPFQYAKGKNIVIVAGGFAVTTLRSAMIWLMDSQNRQNYNEITFIYGARNPNMLLYKNELLNWQKNKEVNVHITVDNEYPGWNGLVGFIPTITANIAPKPNNAIIIICGPPIMIKFTLPILTKLGWKSEQINISLENRMKCGIGICGHCNIGPSYVCKDGPIFTKAQLDNLPNEY